MLIACGDEYNMQIELRYITNSNVYYNLIRGEWVIFFVYGARVQTSAGLLENFSSMIPGAKSRIFSNHTPTPERTDDIYTT